VVFFPAFSVWIDDHHPFAPWAASFLLYAVFQVGRNQLLQNAERDRRRPKSPRSTSLVRSSDKTPLTRHLSKEYVLTALICHIRIIAQSFSTALDNVFLMTPELDNLSQSVAQKYGLPSPLPSTLSPREDNNNKKI